jgi:hypothetical protein
MIEFSLKNKNGRWLKHQGVVWDNGGVSLSNGLWFDCYEAVDVAHGEELFFCIPGEYQRFADAVGHILMLCSGHERYPRLTIQHDRGESYYVFLIDENNGIAFSGSLDDADGPWARPFYEGFYVDEDLLGSGLTVDAKCAKMVAVCKTEKAEMG